jgi:hypothetical protein
MVAAPGLATAPVLSIIGFGNGIQAGMDNTAELRRLRVIVV